MELAKIPHDHASKRTRNLTKVPRDLLLLIVTFLDIRDVCRLGVQCKELNDVCSNNQTWKRLYQTRYPSIHINRPFTNFRHRYAQRCMHADYRLLSMKSSVSDAVLRDSTRDAREKANAKRKQVAYLETRINQMDRVLMLRRVGLVNLYKRQKFTTGTSSK